MILRLLLILFSLLISSFAVDFKKSAPQLEKELIEINEKLNENRKKVFSEREKLSQEITGIKSLLDKNEKSDIQLNGEIDELLNDISELEKKIRFNKNSLIDLLQSSVEARRELETVVPQIKSSQFTVSFKEQDRLLLDKDYLNFLQAYEKSQNELVNDGFRLVIEKTKGVSQKGEVEEAQLITLGHSHAFLLMNKQGGFAEVSRHHNFPALKLVKGSEKGLKNLIQNKSGILPFDFTNGLALKKEAAEKTFYEKFKSGGVIMYPLTFLAILCLAVGLWKTAQLYFIRSQFDEEVTQLVRLIQQGNYEEAKNFTGSLKDPVRSLLVEALSHKDISKDTLEELLNENILSQIPKLDKFMPVLSVSAGAAPLLGLLGTVMGIIKTFEMIALYGTGDPNTMAGGISEALVTTQAGLMVAIPALIWHALLNRRLKAIVGNLEKAMLSFINALSISREKDIV